MASKNQNSSKAIIMAGINRALTKNVNMALYEYKQLFSSKRLNKNCHENSLCYLFTMISSELEKEKYSVVKIQKLLYFIIFSMHECLENQFFAIEVFVDLKKIKKMYDEFKERNPKFNNEVIDNLVHTIDNMLTEARPELTEDDISLSQRFRDINSNLEKELEQKDKEIERLRNEFDTFSKELRRDDRFEDKFEEKKKEVIHLEEELKKAKKQYNSLQKSIQEQVESANEKANEYLAEIESYKEKERKELDRKNTLEKQIQKDKQIEDIIISALLSKNYRERDLLDVLAKQDIYIQRNQLYKYLVNAKLKIKKLYYYNGVPILGIDKSIETGYDISFKGISELKCLFISDLNLTDNNVETYKTIEKIYEYCLKNKIKYVFNLGNIFNIDSSTPIDLEKLNNIEKIINEFIKNYPIEDSITNFILGGNNEILCTNIGYDTLNVIENERYDFSNIKYRNATMTINKISDILNMHSNNNTNNYSSIFSYMNNYYNEHSLTNPSTIDIISTNGNSIVDMNNRFISLPPLMSTDKGCSIYHIDITIKDGELRKFSIYPIMNKEKLLHTSHLYIYK